jgi:hypothetical protein
MNEMGDMCQVWETELVPTGFWWEDLKDTSVKIGDNIKMDIQE